ncbi:MAG: hypothetical protein ACI35O_04075 [Bacillaceae bacterium]
MRNVLVAGEVCYLDHKKYTYMGIDEENKHIIKLYGEEHADLIHTNSIPTVPQLPLGMYLRNKRSKSLCEITGYLNMLGQMYYQVKDYNNVFKDYTHETEHDIMNKFEILQHNPFLEDEVIMDKINEIDKEIDPYKEQLEDIKKTISQIESKKKAVFEVCKHDWDKEEPEEVSNKTFEQLCVCNTCGLEKVNRYSNLW